MMIISIVFAARLYATCNSPHFTSIHLNPPHSTSTTSTSNHHHHHHHPHQKRFSQLLIPINPPPPSNLRPRKFPTPGSGHKKPNQIQSVLKTSSLFFLIRIVSDSAFWCLESGIGEFFYVEEFRGGEGRNVRGCRRCGLEDSGIVYLSASGFKSYLGGWKGVGLGCCYYC